jgi:hypothetical protein
MKKLTIEAGKETPKINFDGSIGYFNISGKSYPENVNDFYEPIFEYIEQYQQNIQPKTTLEFNWLYYNTATAKVIMKIIMQLKEVSRDIQINWYYKKDFELIMEKGKEIKDILDVNMTVAEQE